ncbi:sensory rhodopsin transducer [Paenibacillus sp.]|uniref:sensory rhodopsin transducer n=1 Tax=Paenibacillus sp. TaxID=58172 RepID=UPI002D52C65F|nr:sensory rhodopsin transducer [Paenibacillus sp.]HZG85469.1 sensory rhodopsin transducer [Paenibacillus sp.]
MAANGYKVWYIPDGYIPPISTGSLTSHESICVLNTNEADANLLVTVYFEDRDPIENVEVRVGGRRTAHVRTSSLEKNGESIPVGVPYAMEVRSDVPIIVQYSRMDATQPANTLATTMGFPVAAE